VWNKLKLVLQSIFKAEPFDCPFVFAQDVAHRAGAWFEELFLTISRRKMTVTSEVTVI
jgi:hypothetical protein